MLIWAVKILPNSWNIILKKILKQMNKILWNN